VVVHESMSTDKVLTAKRIRHFSRWARQFICTYFMIWKDLDEQQDDRMDAKVDRTSNTWSRPHQPWEACQMIQNTLLCPRFRHSFLRGDLCLWSNKANNRATK
jgi:hypothetical protein